MNDLDPRIEKVARALCQAEGLDPSLEVDAAPTDLGVRAIGSGASTRFVAERWKLYARLARAHVIAHDILNGD